MEGAFVREGEYIEHTDTGRPGVRTPFDDIPLHRNPGTDTYEFLLDKWTVMQIGDTIQFRRDWTVDDAITTSNINDDDSVRAFLDWVNDMRVTGAAVGDDITTINSFNSRTYDLVQGGAAETLTIQLSSQGQQLRDDDTFEWVVVAFVRVSTETDEISIGDIRATLGEATGTLDVDPDDVDDTPEIPVRGATNTPFHASEIIFPDGNRLYPVGGRLVHSNANEGMLALDGASVRSVRYAELDDISGETNAKWMPNDGHSVIHFGHEETADSILRYRTLGDMLLSDGDDIVQRIHNVSDTYNVTLEANDESTLLRMRPFEQSGPFQVALEAGGAMGEILAIAPPDRHLVYARGAAAPHFDDGTRYAQTGAVGAHYYNSLRFQTAAVEHLDNDAFTNGEDDDPTGTAVNAISPASWSGVRGSFTIERPGWVSIQLRYRLAITDPAPSGQINQGNGPSVWISEGGTAALTLDHFSGAEAVGGTGGTQEYHLIYRGKHAANTLFVFLHRIPFASDIDIDDYDHIDMEALGGSIVLSPEIRKVITP